MGHPLQNFENLQVDVRELPKAEEIETRNISPLHIERTSSKLDILSRGSRTAGSWTNKVCGLGAENLGGYLAQLSHRCGLGFSLYV